jgi:hypothetical protein
VQREKKPLRSTDRITLSVPNERPFFGVARLLVGGLGARLELPYEHLDDLQLAVESILLNGEPTGDRVSLEASIEEQLVAIWVGPLRTASAAAQAGQDGAINLDWLLATLVDSVESVERTGEPWLRLEKRIPTRQR